MGKSHGPSPAGAAGCEAPCAPRGGDRGQLCIRAPGGRPADATASRLPPPACVLLREALHSRPIPAIIGCRRTLFQRTPPSPVTLTLRIFSHYQEVDAHAWDQLLLAQGDDDATPFLRHAYLAALHDSGSATAETGWGIVFFTVWDGETMEAACAVYLKNHSYGEYVFDWAWANAYADHGLAYYPKAVVAVPFTPVPGARLLARTAEARGRLVQALVAWCGDQDLSSLHLLFLSDPDVAACRDAGLMLRNTVQFHWHNRVPVASRTPAEAAPSFHPYTDFDGFLASLTQEKRKKIRQERRKVAEAGVSFRWSRGADIAPQDWDFFYRCYARTYREHGNAPYLTRDFFRRMEQQMPENWLLFVAERQGHPIASSLIAISPHPAPATAPKGPEPGTPADAGGIAYGRYWGALERVDCLHFEACYYQPIAWCIAHGFTRFEGGAQGEHKMARALMPVATTSAHWLARPDFSDAVERFLEREGEGIAHYMEHLDARSPFRHGED